MPPPPPVDSTGTTGNTMGATLSSTPFGGCPAHQIYAVPLGATLSKEGPMELDSHADTCCAGSNCTKLEYTSKICNIVSCHQDNPNMQMAGIPIVKAATAYDSPTGDTFIIVLAQSLYLGDHIEYSPLCPNQLRHSG
jgi:hypothetical protein